jgi:hypothetical protein
VFGAVSAYVGPVVSNLLERNVGEEVLRLVEFFNLIEFFGVASLFGWLTFAALLDTDRQLKGLSAAKKKRATDNRVILNDLFIISFLFFSASGVLDYLLHHLTLSSGIALLVPQPLALVGTLDTFVVGMLLLVAPVWYEQRIAGQGKTLGDVRLPPTLMILWLFGTAVLSSTIVWTAGFSSAEGFYEFMALGVVPFIGLGVGLKYSDDRRKRILACKMLLLSAPILVVLALIVIAALTGTLRTVG